jgi:hypothetical protein
MPIQTKITVKDGAVRLGLQRFGDALKKVTKKEMLSAVTEAKQRVSHYPPERPNQKYIRTGAYGRSWNITTDKGAKSYTLKSSGVKYARYVGGYADGTGQAMVHAGRWALLQAAMQRAAKRFVVRMKDRIGQIAKDAGLK